MSITLERIFALVKESGKSEYAIKKETGLKNSTFSEWKAGRANPSTDAIITLAQYFNVSTDYLLGLTNLPLAPASWFIFKEKIFDTHNHTLEELANAICQPISIFTDWQLGLEPDDTTLWAICNFYQLHINPFIKAKTTPPSKQYTNIVENNDIEQLLAKNKDIDYMDKIYKALNEKQKLFVLTWLVGYAKSQKINI